VILKCVLFVLYFIYGIFFKINVVVVVNIVADDVGLLFVYFVVANVTY